MAFGTKTQNPSFLTRSFSWQKWPSKPRKRVVSHSIPSGFRLVILVRPRRTPPDRPDRQLVNPLLKNLPAELLRRSLYHGVSPFMSQFAKRLDNNFDIVYFKVDYFQEDKGAYLDICQSKVGNSISIGSGSL